MGVRTLARHIDPANPERARRALNKWLAGEHSPSRSSRHTVEDALGVERGTLDSDDEEESDPVADLLHALKAFVRAELRESAAT